MRTPIVPSRYHTLGSCLNTSALMRIENPMIPPTSELNPGRRGEIRLMLSVVDQTVVKTPCRNSVFLCSDLPPDKSSVVTLEMLRLNITFTNQSLFLRTWEQVSPVKQRNTAHYWLVGNYFTCWSGSKTYHQWQGLDSWALSQAWTWSQPGWCTLSRWRSTHWRGSHPERQVNRQKDGESCSLAPLMIFLLHLLLLLTLCQQTTTTEQHCRFLVYNSFRNGHDPVCTSLPTWYPLFYLLTNLVSEFVIKTLSYHHTSPSFTPIIPSKCFPLLIIALALPGVSLSS